MRETYWADNGLARGFPTWFSSNAELIDPLLLLAKHRFSTKLSMVVAYDVDLDYASFVGLTYPLLYIRN